MSQRKFQMPENTRYEKCPKCGNNTKFTAYSDYCAEDCCEVWVVCACGYDPTFGQPHYRFEDVWGGVDDNNCRNALEVWNDLIIEAVPV